MAASEATITAMRPIRMRLRTARAVGSPLLGAGARLSRRRTLSSDGHRLSDPRRRDRLQPRPSSPATGEAGVAASPRARRRRDPPLRRGDRGARATRRASARPADDRPRLDRRHRGSLAARVRSQLQADLAAGPPPLAGDRHRDAPRRRDAADRGLPGRRPSLRHRRPPPGLGRAPDGPREDRRDGDRDHHRGPRRAGDLAARPAAQVARAAVLRARPAAAADEGADQPRERLRLRRPRRGRRGLGISPDAVPARVHDPRAGRRDLVSRGVRAGDRDDAGGRPLRARQRDRGLRPRRQPPLPTAADPRLERRGRSSSCERSCAGPPRTRTPSSTASGATSPSPARHPAGRRSPGRRTAACSCRARARPRLRARPCSRRRGGRRPG